MTSNQTGGVMELERGMAVFSRDGQQLGKVDETRPDHFKVDAPHARDYWLERRCVERADAEGVVVAFNADDLDDHRTTEPGEAGAVPATSTQQSYIPGASKEDANVHYDPNVAKE